jgi:hypothetical protein
VSALLAVPLSLGPVGFSVGICFAHPL